MRRIKSTCLTSHNQYQYFKSKTPFSHPTKNPNQIKDIENGEGEREIYCTWDIILQLGSGERGIDTTTERWTCRWRFRPGSELRWGAVLQTWTHFPGLVQSSNMDCGAMELARWECQQGSENGARLREGSEKREIFVEKKISENCV